MHSDFSLSSTPPRNRLLCHSHCSCVHCDSRLVRKYSITILYISRYFQSYYIAYWFADARHCDSKANPKTVINSFHINPPLFNNMNGRCTSVSVYFSVWMIRMQMVQPFQTRREPPLPRKQTWYSSKQLCASYKYGSCTSKQQQQQQYSL